MLINTVLVFLNSALPAFFFVSICSSLFRPYTIPLTWKLSSSIIGLLGAFLLSKSMGAITELFDGAGFELLSAFIYLMIFIFLIYQMFHNSRKEVPSDTLLFVFATGVSLTFIINGASLLIYVYGFWSSLESPDSMIIGSVIGLGISLSSALLLLYVLRSNFLLKWLKLPYAALIFIAARQLSELSLNLIQADWLSSRKLLWDTSKFVMDNSQIGRFLNALVGYEAKPTLTQTLFYFTGIVIPILAIHFSNKLTPPVNEDLS